MFLSPAWLRLPQQRIIPADAAAVEVRAVPAVLPALAELQVPQLQLTVVQAVDAVVQQADVVRRQVSRI